MKSAHSSRPQSAFAVGVGTLLISLIASAAPTPGAGWQAGVSSDLLKIYSAASTTGQSAPPSKVPSSQSALGARFDAKGRVQVDVHVNCVVPPSTAVLAAAGLKIGTVVHVPPYCVVEGWVAPASLPTVASVAGVTRVKLPAYAWRKQPKQPLGQLSPATAPPPLAGSGDALTQGAGGFAIDGSAVTLMRADQYISQTTANGAGVTVGVMSRDATNVAVIQARGELPTPIQDVTPTGSTNPTPTDEGTMMLEEVHAVAPGATLAFCGPQTSLEYVACLGNLISAGASVLVDDLAYPDEDLMSTTSTFAQGVKGVLTQNPNVALFTVTDNYNGSYWEGAYGPVLYAGGTSSLTCSANGQVDTYVQSFGSQVWAVKLTVGVSGTYPIAFEWADPFDQNVSNFDIYLLALSTDALTCFPAAGSSATEMFGDLPLSAGTYYIFIATPDASLGSKFLKLFVGGGGATSLALPTTGSIVSPQAFVSGVTTVGAVLASDGVGNTIEPYSGLGPINLRFPTPTSLQAPLVVAPDAIYVDAANTDFTSELWPDGLFHGTSAAAPNAAAVAALLRSAFPNLTPVQLVQALESGATQLGGTVPDETFGYGRVDAIGALSTLQAPTISGFTTATIVGGSSSTSLPFNVGGTGNLRVSVSPASLIPANSSGVSLSPANCGSGSNACTVVLTPSMALSGSTIVTLTVMDGANRTASYQASVTVTKPPSPTVTITSGGSQSVDVNAPLSPVAFMLRGTGPLTVTPTTNGVSQVTISAGCGTTAMQCTASLGNAASIAGTETLSITSTDGYGQVASAMATFNVTQPPSASGGSGGTSGSGSGSTSGSGSGSTSGSGSGGGAVDLISLLGLGTFSYIRRRRPKT